MRKQKTVISKCTFKTEYIFQKAHSILSLPTIIGNRLILLNHQGSTSLQKKKKKKKKNKAKKQVVQNSI